MSLNLVKENTHACVSVSHKIKVGSCILNWRLARKDLDSCILAGGRHCDSDVNSTILNAAIVCLDNGLTAFSVSYL